MSKSSGIGFIGLLQILFVALKLGNVIKWDWAWVLSPLWISLSVIILFIIVMCIVALVSKE